MIYVNPKREIENGSPANAISRSNGFPLLDFNPFNQFRNADRLSRRPHYAKNYTGFRIVRVSL